LCSPIQTALSVLTIAKATHPVKHDGRVGSLLFVVYTERGKEPRLVTAMEAEKRERRSYNGYYHIDGKGWTKAT
jgi:hypothetical protein